MAIVGQAIVQVRVISDRLGADIRDAVKKGLADANGDIDAAGESAGKRMSDGVAKGVRKNREKLAKEVGAELVLSSRRFVADSDGAIDDAGDRLGRIFVNGIRDGVDEEYARNFLGEYLARKFREVSDDADLDEIGRLIGNRFMRSISAGTQDNETVLRQQVQQSVTRAITAGGTGDNSALVRIGKETGDNFTRAIGSGLGDGDGKDFFDNEFRRVFSMGDGSVIDGDSEVIGERIMGGVRRGVRRSIPDTARAFRDSASNARDTFKTELGLHLQAFKGIGLEWGEQAGTGFVSGNAFQRAGREAGKKAGDAAAAEIGNSARRNNGRMRVEWSRIGKDLGDHFNLGIGAAKMGAGIISILTTAGPSLISGAAAIGTAMAAEIITAMAAIGPGIGGAVGVGLAAFSSLALSAGLFYAAIKSGVAGLSEVGTRFKALGKVIGTPIAENMLSGITDMVSRLEVALPELNELLRGTGTAFGGVAQRIGETITSAENMTRIKSILATNNVFIDNLGRALAGLTTSFLILFAAAKPFVDYVGQAAANFAEWAAQTLAVNEANGSLSAWMDRMLAAFKDLWQITKDFGAGFANIFEAAAPAGKTMLDSIRDIGERFRAWTSDSAGMDRMEAFFVKARTLASKVWEVLGAIFTAGGRAFEAMDIGPILHVLDTLQNVVAPAIARFFNQIQAGASDNLVRAFDNIGVALTKIADNGGFEKVANLIGTVIEKITEFAATDMGAAILAIVLPFAIMGGILTSLLGPLVAVGKGLFILAQGAGLVSAPILAVAAAIAAAVAAFVVMWNNSERLRESIGNLGSAVGGTFSDVWGVLAPKIQAIWEKFQLLAGVIGDRLAPVIEFLTPIVQRAIDILGSLFGNIFQAIEGLIDLLTGILTGDWSKIWEGLTEIVSAAWNQIVTIFDTARAAISFAWDAITAVVYNAGQVLYKFFASIWTGIQTVTEGAWDGIAGFFTDVWNGISETAVSIWNSITEFFSGIWDGVSEAGTTGWETLTSNLEGIWNGISSKATEIWGGITSFFSTIWDGIRSAAETAWNGLVAFLGGVWNAIVVVVGGGLNVLLQIFLIPFKIIRNLFVLLWDGIGEYVIGVWNWIVDQAITIWGGITSFFSTVWDGVLAVANYVWTQITTSLTGAWNIISSLAQTIWSGITSFFSTVWDGILAVASYVWDQITTSLEGAWNIIANIAEAVWSGITAFFSTVWDGIQIAAEFAWNAITSFLSAAWEGIVSIATTIWSGIVEFFSFMWEQISLGAQTVWGVITDFLSTVWAGIVAIATTIWTGVVTFFQFVWDTISNAAQAVWNALTAFLSTVWTGISSVATTIWTAISAFFTGIWNTISNTFHSIVDPLVSWLSARWTDISNTASSIWNGITNIASTAWNAVVNAVMNVVRPIVQWLSDRWNDITNAISSAWNGLSGIVSGIWNGIKTAIVQPIADAYNALTGWIADIKALVSGAWDSISGTVTNINNAIAGAADAIQQSNELSAGLNSPFAPGAAEGGVFRPTPGGQLRTIAEAGQAERVEPLDPNGLSVRDLAWVDKLLEASGGVGGGVTVKVFIGEQELTSLVNTQVERSNSALARDARSRRV